LTLKYTLTLARTSKELHRTLLLSEDNVEPWVSYRRQLVQLIPERLIGSNVLRFYAKTLSDLAKNKPVNLWTADDCTIAACIMFPFGRGKEVDFPSTYDILRVSGDAICGFAVATLGHRTRARRLTVFIRRSGQCFEYRVKREEVAWSCSMLTKSPRQSFYKLLERESGFRDVIEFKEAAWIRNNNNQ